MKKESFSNYTYKFLKSSFIPIISLLLLSSGCSQNTDDNTPSEKPGNISFQATIANPNSKGLFEIAAIDCNASGISSIQADVYNAEGELIVTGGPWDCNAHSGTIESVKPGEGLKVTVTGKDAAGTTNYTGDKAGITVTSGETVEVGAITLSPTLSPVAGAPPVDDNPPNEDPPAVAIIRVEPLLLNFGAIPVGTIATPETITITNDGDATLNVDPIPEVLEPYRYPTNYPNQCVNPVILPPGESCELRIAFFGLAAGDFSDEDYSIAITSNGGDALINLLASSYNGWVSISAGLNHTLAIKSDKTLWAWGYNGNGFGNSRLGDGTFNSSTIPIQIRPDLDWKQVSARNNFSLALTSTGKLYAWGNNTNGQLGSNSFTHSITPTPIEADKTWSFISAGGGFSLGILTDGSLYAWGNNDLAQLGVGDQTRRFIPTLIDDSKNWLKISSSARHTLALTTDGSLYAWGYNGSGQLGDGSNNLSKIPIPIATDKKWADIAAQSDHSLAVTTDGTLHSWGANSYGQLGNNKEGDPNVPTPIAEDKRWKKLSAGFNSSLGITTNGEIFGWGINSFGQLGLGAPIEAFFPTQEASNDTTWTNLITGNSHTMATKADGSLWGWGNNASGELGNGAPTASSNHTPLEIIPAPDDLPNGTPALTVEALSNSKIALTWSNNADNVTGYDIERSNTPCDENTNLLNFITVNEQPLNPDAALTYTDTGLVREQAYCYRVIAFNAFGKSPSQLETIETLSTYTLTVQISGTGNGDVDIINGGGNGNVLNPGSCNYTSAYASGRTCEYNIDITGNFSYETNPADNSVIDPFPSGVSSICTYTEVSGSCNMGYSNRTITVTYACNTFISCKTLIRNPADTGGVSR